MGDAVLVDDDWSQPIEGVDGAGDLVARELVTGYVVGVEVVLFELLKGDGGNFTTEGTEGDRGEVFGFGFLIGGLSEL